MMRCPKILKVTLRSMTKRALTEQFTGDQWPHFLSVDHQKNDVSLRLEVLPSVHWLQGHFPEQAVLAGVVQTHWAAELGKYFFPVGDDFQRLDNLKFQSVILPGQELDLALHFDETKHTIKFQYTDEDKTFSEGKLLFGRQLDEQTPS
jgi:3-hydroxymyristoyl/3-hydroxydecanoyl-(acyl carrier protein) dehydratase